MIKTTTKFGDEVIINEKNITVCTLTMDKSIFISFIDGSSVVIKEPFDSFFAKLKECEQVKSMDMTKPEQISIVNKYLDNDIGKQDTLTETVSDNSSFRPFLKEGLVSIELPRKKPGRKPGSKANTKPIEVKS